MVVPTIVSLNCDGEVSSEDDGRFRKKQKGPSNVVELNECTSSRSSDDDSFDSESLDYESADDFGLTSLDFLFVDDIFSGLGDG